MMKKKLLVTLVLMIAILCARPLVESNYLAFAQENKEPSPSTIDILLKMPIHGGEWTNPNVKKIIVGEILSHRKESAWIDQHKVKVEKIYRGDVKDNEITVTIIRGEPLKVGSKVLFLLKHLSSNENEILLVPERLAELSEQEYLFFMENSTKLPSRLPSSITRILFSWTSHHEGGSTELIQKDNVYTIVDIFTGVGMGYGGYQHRESIRSLTHEDVLLYLTSVQDLLNKYDLIKVDENELLSEVAITFFQSLVIEYNDNTRIRFGTAPGAFMGNPFLGPDIVIILETLDDETYALSSHDFFSSIKGQLDSILGSKTAAPSVDNLLSVSLDRKVYHPCQKIRAILRNPTEFTLAYDSQLLRYNENTHGWESLENVDKVWMSPLGPGENKTSILVAPENVGRYKIYVQTSHKENVFLPSLMLSAEKDVRYDVSVEFLVEVPKVTNKSIFLALVIIALCILGGSLLLMKKAKFG